MFTHTTPRSFLPHHTSYGLGHFLLEMLMERGEERSLVEDSRHIDQEVRLDKETRDELKKLMAYRSFYDEEHKAQMSPEARKAVADYDWEWTLELAMRMYGFVPEALIGKRPMPERIKAMQPLKEAKAEEPKAEVKEPKTRQETYEQALQRLHVLNGPSMMPTMRSPRATGTSTRR